MPNRYPCSDESAEGREAERLQREAEAREARKFKVQEELAASMAEAVVEIKGLRTDIQGLREDLQSFKPDLENRAEARIAIPIPNNPEEMDWNHLAFVVSTLFFDKVYPSENPPQKHHDNFVKSVQPRILKQLEALSAKQRQEFLEGKRQETFEFELSSVGKYDMVVHVLKISEAAISKPNTLMRFAVNLVSSPFSFSKALFSKASFKSSANLFQM